uniref:NADH-ubiquinone oxidoreductase chain 5 n=1 Tax=Conwentzia sinica TaxID=450904 RepID=A0A7U1AQC5_9NEOP|nr:NADH dehydrogenase subunit 5 [Conwentzia sinica]QQY84955.1 NADH dehydrogenase subunit 5 [Conwentzia sinica]
MSICNLYMFIFLSISMISFMSGLYFLSLDLVYLVEWELINLNSFNLTFTMLFDFMSLLFMSLVLYISSMVILYSRGYMGSDKNISRFIMLVVMFVVSMMFLIISPNLVSILLGWDGLGLVSFVLVIYYQNIKSYNAGMLTVLSNRIGDVMILLSISWMLNFGSWNYIFYLNELFSLNEFLKVIIMLLMIAAMTKSAQIPFSSWLPAAMAAPTPVSSLVHSSTLVTAGVYLLIRFNELLISNLNYSILLLLIGSLTMFMSGLGANFEMDLKKIIALSTLSQLGLMMSTLSLGLSMLAFFHLLTHAMFKAMLFMCAGVYIHNMKNNQDLRKTGSISFLLPFTTICFLFSNLALCGFPFLTGFYSKDLILEMVLMSDLNYLIFLLYFISTGLTVSYSFRLIYYMFIKNYSGMNLIIMSENNLYLYMSMLGLVLFSIFGGSMLMWLMLKNVNMIYLPIFMKNLTLVVVISGAYLGYELSKFNITLNIMFFFKNYLLSFLGSMWFMPYITLNLFNKSILNWGYKYLKLMDHGWSEFFGGQFIMTTLMENSKNMQSMLLNSMKIYFLFTIFLLMIFVMIIMY